MEGCLVANIQCCPDRIFKTRNGESQVPTREQLEIIREEVRRERPGVCIQVISLPTLMRSNMIKVFYWMVAVMAIQASAFRWYTFQLPSDLKWSEWRLSPHLPGFVSTLGWLYTAKTNPMSIAHGLITLNSNKNHTYSPARPAWP